MAEAYFKNKDGVSPSAAIFPSLQTFLDNSECRSLNLAIVKDPQSKREAIFSIAA